MAIIITENIQKILDASNAMEEVISVEVKEVPPHILSQIEPQDCIYLDYKIVVDSGEEIPVAFVLPVDSITDDLYKLLPIKDLISCSCVIISGKEDDFCVSNPFYNRGKTTYFVRKPDYYMLRLADQQPKVVSIFDGALENLGKLVEKLKQIPKVNYIQVEEIIDQKLKASLDCPNPYIILANIEIDFGPIKSNNVSFAITETIYNSELSHEWAVNNLKELIEINNA